MRSKSGTVRLDQRPPPPRQAPRLLRHRLRVARGSEAAFGRQSVACGRQSGARGGGRRRPGRRRPASRPESRAAAGTPARGRQRSRRRSPDRGLGLDGGEHLGPDALAAGGSAATARSATIATEPLVQPHAAPATRPPSRAVTANGRPSPPAAPSTASRAAASGSGRAVTVELDLDAAPPDDRRARRGRRRRTASTTWSGRWRSTCTRSKRRPSAAPAGQRGAAPASMPLRRRQLLGQGHVGDELVGVVGPVERRPPTTRRPQARRGASAPAPPTARCTVGVTGANVVAGPSVERERRGRRRPPAGRGRAALEQLAGRAG